MPVTPKSAEPIRVLLVDDHAVVRAGCRALLKNAGDIEIAGEAASGEGAFKAYFAHKPGVLIMDLSLPGMGGLEAIRRIVSRDSEARILVFSEHDETVFVDRALTAGARGYITKRSSANVLTDAVRQVAGGKIYLDRDIAQRMAFQRTRGTNSPFVGLSTREFEVFCLLAEGLAAPDIARRLSLSYKTVANYSTQIKAKLGVNTQAQLARLAIRHGVAKV